MADFSLDDLGAIEFKEFGEETNVFIRKHCFPSSKHGDQGGGIRLEILPCLLSSGEVLNRNRRAAISFAYMRFGSPFALRCAVNRCLPLLPSLPNRNHHSTAVNPRQP